MKKHTIMAGCISLMLMATSCSDYFLDLYPTDTQTEANYYQTAEQFEAAANGTYSFYGFKDVSEKVNGTNYTHSVYNIWDNGSDHYCPVKVDK